MRINVNDGPTYRAKAIIHLQALGLIPTGTYDGSVPASELLLTNAHNAVSVYLLGVPDVSMPIGEVDGAQQFLQTKKAYTGPVDSHWSPATSTALHAVLDPLKAAPEMAQLCSMMYERQAGVLRQGWLASLSGVPPSNLRVQGDLTDAFSNNVYWRVILLNASQMSVYDTHALASYNVGIVGVSYVGKPEMIQALQVGWGYSTRTGIEYGPSTIVNYIACTVSTILPYRYLIFSRPAVS